MVESAIYAITNTANGKQYVGSACHFQRRWSEHLNQLRRGAHPNKRLQNAWQKYGSEAFVFSVIEYVADKASLISREQHWMDALNVVMAGYNIAPKAGSQLGMKHSAETRAKLSASHMGFKPSKEAIEKTTRAITGRKKSPEHIAKVAAAQRGKFVSAESRLKMSIAQKAVKRGPLSAETRAKIAAAHTGKAKPPHTDEWRLAMSKKMTGRKMSPDAIAKRVATRAANRAAKAKPGQAFIQ